MAILQNVAGSAAPIVLGGAPGLRGPEGAASTVPGPAGGPGPQGRDGAGAIVSRIAAVAIPPWTAVVSSGSDRVIPADPTNPAHRGQVIGVTAYGALQGAAVSIQNTGDLFGLVGPFSAGDALFVGAGGAVVSIPPTSGWRQIVAGGAATNHIVVTLGEASLILDGDAMLLGAGGFSTPATTAQGVSGQGGSVYTTPDNVRGHVGTRIGVSPYDFITDEATQTAIRTGVNPPSCDDAFQQFLDAWIAGAGDCGSAATVPAGTWVLDRVHEVMLTSPGRNRKFHLHFSPGAKLVPSDANRFRYAVQGEWDAAANPGMLSAGSGNFGDVWVAISPSNSLNLSGITNVNVGDQVYKGVNGWQKVLCRANYRYQFWDASSNTDDKGNLVILPSIGDEYDCFIVGKAGNANIDGVSSWALGDEAIFIRGKWRKKQVQGGTFKGTWDPSANAPSLNNGTSSGAPGDWYVVGGASPAYAPISLGNGNTTGLGEFITTVPGEKIWCVAPGKWQKCYASPTPRQTWTPATDKRYIQWYPASAPAGTTNTTIGASVVSENLSSRGAYGDLYEITMPGTGTTGSLTRTWSRGEFLFYGANGWEVIAQDPNWNRGLFRFIHDDKTTLNVTGRVTITPRSPQSGLKEWSEGIYIRNHSLQRAGYAQYLYQGVMLDVEHVWVGGDASDAALAQFNSGIAEAVWETKTLYLPTFRKVDLLAPATASATRRLEVVNYPRLMQYGIRHLDGYVTTCHEFACNGGFNKAYACESDCWSVEHASWEGGYLKIGGANMMTGAYFGHGLRAYGGLEPTLEVIAGDLGFARYGVHIKGHSGINLTIGRPILPGVGGADPMIEQPAFLMLEEVYAANIGIGLPTAGAYTDSEHFSSVIRTRGGVFDIRVSGIQLQDMKGVAFNLRHNANTASPFAYGYTSDYKVHVENCHGYTTDTATLKLVYSNNTLALVDGGLTFLQHTFSRGITVGGAFAHTGTTLGFYNKAPVAVPTITFGANTTQQQLDQIKAALSSLGLIVVAG